MIITRITQAILYVLSIYFLVNESRQVMSSGISYLASVWNYVDFLPPFLIVAIISVHIAVYYETEEGKTPNINDFIVTVHAIASFLMWIKMLYFMRIFESTAYLVRML